MIEFLVLVAAVITGRAIYDYAKKKIDNRYKWTCPVGSCEFGVSGNDSDTIAAIKNSHIQTHTGGGIV